MPDPMEFLTTEEELRYYLTLAQADATTAIADAGAAQADATTAIGDAGDVDTRVGNAVIAMNANGVGYTSACLESTETGNGIIMVFNFTIPGGVMVTNSETVFSLGVQQKRTSQYSVTGAQQITFTGGNEPASEHVYMDVLVPVTFVF